MSTIAPGWYKDPAEPTTQRYWDGEGWIGDPLPIDATPPDGPPPTAAPPAPQVPAGPTPQVPAGPAGQTPTGPTLPARYAAPAPPAPGPVPAGPVHPGPVHPGPVPPGPVPPGYRLVYARPPAPRPHGYDLASPGRRLAARAIDTVALLLLNVVANGWFVYLWWQGFWPYYQEFQRRWTAGEPVNDIPVQDTSYELLIFLVGVTLWFAYEVPALVNNGQTFGKRLVGIKVVPLAEEAPLGFVRALRRWNPLGLPTFLWPCFGIGFVLQFIDCLFVAVDSPLRQALHDKSAGTVVVAVGRDGGGRTAAAREANPQPTDRSKEDIEA